MGRDGIDVVEIDFSYFSPSFHFSYSSLPFSPLFISFSLLSSSFLHFIFSSLFLLLLFFFLLIIIFREEEDNFRRIFHKTRIWRWSCCLKRVLKNLKCNMKGYLLVREIGKRYVAM